MSFPIAYLSKGGEKFRGYFLEPIRKPVFVVLKSEVTKNLNFTHTRFFAEFILSVVEGLKMTFLGFLDRFLGLSINHSASFSQSRFPRVFPVFFGKARRILYERGFPQINNTGEENHVNAKLT
jgi:hypothetical protein